MSAAAVPAVAAGLRGHQTRHVQTAAVHPVRFPGRAVRSARRRRRGLPRGHRGDRAQAVRDHQTAAHSAHVERVARPRVRRAPVRARVVAHADRHLVRVERQKRPRRVDHVPADFDVAERDPRRPRDRGDRLEQRRGERLDIHENVERPVRCGLQLSARGPGVRGLSRETGSSDASSREQSADRLKMCDGILHERFSFELRVRYKFEKLYSSYITVLL